MVVQIFFFFLLCKKRKKKKTKIEFVFSKKFEKEWKKRKIIHFYTFIVILNDPISSTKNFFFYSFPY